MSCLLTAIAGIFAIVFCGYYLLHSYDELQRHYLYIIPCMYREDLWKEGFFNQHTKHAGNIYAIIGIVTVVLIVTYIYLKKGKVGLERIEFRAFIVNNAWYILALLLATTGLWIWGNYKSVPAYDEVFSAVNCSSVHPAQTVAYYMLPNNHVLFNLLNNIIFHPFDDKVLTGRIISGLSQITFALLLYWWLAKKLNSRGYALLYTTLLLLQFPVWGFSFQARGYALYLLCAAASAIGTEQYFITKKQVWLCTITITTIAGYCVMPSFLFWHAGLLLVACFYFIRERKLDGSFIKAQIFAGLCIYCFYLPGLCYSGLVAFTENPYVKAQVMPFSDFVHDFQKNINSTIQYSFGGDVDARRNIYTLLFYLPLLFTPLLIRTNAGRLLIINLGIWTAFLLLQLKFKHYPFMRNMTAHVSISLCALLLCLHFTLLWLSKKIRMNALLPVGAALFCTAAAVHFIRFMNGHIHDSLYFYDARHGYDMPMSTIQKLPVDAPVWCSDQSFYLQYLLQRRGTPVSHCMVDSQLYYITDRNEGVPLVPVSVDIRPTDSVLQYIIYRKM